MLFRSDLALWDILGQSTNLPIYRLLGGPVRNQIAVYNSCGNPSYGRNPEGLQGWPGYGSIGQPGDLQDSYKLFHAPEELVAELLEAGYTAFKTWLFDSVAHRSGGMRIGLQELEETLRPLVKIRERFGNQMEFMVDGHGFFMLPAALRIAEALKPLQPLWLEDILKTDNLETLVDFRRQSRMPISISEMLLSRADFTQILAHAGADYVMIDPTWVGGISESVRIAHIAQAYNIPVTLHDCTGPLTLFAGLHVNAVVPGCCFQETVRAHIQTFYADLIDTPVPIAQGHTPLPTRPGLGTRLNPDLFEKNRYQYRITRV